MEVTVKKRQKLWLSKFEGCGNGDGIIATGRRPKFRSLSLSLNVLLLAWCGDRCRWVTKGGLGDQYPKVLS